LATTRAKRREQRLQSLILDRLTFKYERLIAKEIGRTMLSTNLSDPLAIEQAERTHTEKLKKLLTKMWGDAGNAMVEQVFGTTQKALLSTFAPTVGVNAVMTDYARRYGLEKVTQISRTTINQLKNVIQTGIEEGLSERNLSKLIRERAPIIASSRAQTIARTETHAAANFAIQESAKSAEIEARREWVSAENERTRESHSQANGQIVGMNEPFNVDGEDLMYPGDPSGSPENVINCRCAVVFVFD
jgi:SPP1 gp7 family putative phage head morphogenesis protein